MDKDKFWEIISEVRNTLKPGDDIIQAYRTRLSKLSNEELSKWDNYLNLYMSLAETNNLAMAAFAINQYISDDTFIYFQAWLVSQGKEIYMNAQKDADSLADTGVESETASFEHFWYVPTDVYYTRCEKKDIVREILTLQHLSPLSDEEIDEVKREIEFEENHVFNIGYIGTYFPKLVDKYMEGFRLQI